MKNFTKSLIFLGLFAIVVTPAVAQEEGEYLNRTFQVTLFPPIGSNKSDAQNCVNRISLNLLWGISSGLKGIEIGGINIERDFVKGAQFAGIANLVSGNVTGVQVSPFVNIAKGQVRGGQITGFLNLSDTVSGLGAAGFMNIGENIRGMQGAGFMNIASEVAGVQTSGFMNIAGPTRGIQATGFLNMANEVKGAQVSGYMNITNEVRGAQVAGFMNTAQEVKGTQVSGFLNLADNVRGTQIGFINIANNYEKGVPIGFVNIVKHGYHDWELAGNEIWDFNLGYRMGIDRLYTQFMFGSHRDKNDKFWGFGVGIGTRFGITHYLKGSVDLITYQLIENHHLYAKRPNLLEQVRFTIEGKILRKLKWFVGPTFNMLITPFVYPEPAFLEHITPWSVYENASGVSYIKMWPGISGGIRF